VHQLVELGIVNVGGTGTVTADGQTYASTSVAAPGTSCSPTRRPTANEAGAQFYLFSAPAHTTCPTQLVLKGEGTVRELGDQLTSNRRTLNQYIHENGIRSCQITMG
jgi:4-deoxy-L-threo-5-hexosulose-uronate ketol-isomerase